MCLFNNFLLPGWSEIMSIDQHLLSQLDQPAGSARHDGDMSWPANHSLQNDGECQTGEDEGVLLLSVLQDGGEGGVQDDGAEETGAKMHYSGQTSLLAFLRRGELQGGGEGVLLQAEEGGGGGSVWRLIPNGGNFVRRML